MDGIGAGDLGDVDLRRRGGRVDARLGGLGAPRVHTLDVLVGRILAGLEAQLLDHLAALLAQRLERQQLDGAKVAIDELGAGRLAELRQEGHHHQPTQLFGERVGGRVEPAGQRPLAVIFEFDVEHARVHRQRVHLPGSTAARAWSGQLGQQRIQRPLLGHAPRRPSPRLAVTAAVVVVSTHWSLPDGWLSCPRVGQCA